MSIRDVIKGYVGEKEQIAKKRAALDEREAFIDLILKELEGATKKSKPAAKAPPKKRRGRKKRGGVTVRDAILQAVTQAGKAVTAGQIVEAAGKLSGGAVASIRTQINGLTKDGMLKQVPFSGRGFQYTISTGKPPTPAKKARKKAAKKAKKRVAKPAAK